MVDGGPLDDLAAALHRLRRRAGEPSMRQIAGAIRYSHTVVADAFKGLRCPTWPVLKAIVMHLEGDPQVFMYCWLAVRDQERPLPPMPNSPRESGLAGTGHNGDLGEDEVGSVNTEDSATTVHLTYKHGPHTFIFTSERLAWRFLKMRGGEFSD
jgi:hypothetical protein